MKYTNVLRIQTVISPAALQKEFPISTQNYEAVRKARTTIKNILQGQDKRFLIIAGPCSVHDERAIIEYAEKLRRAQDEFADKFFFVLRLYFEKPRTLLGWRGLIVEPDFDGVINIERGLKIARTITGEIVTFGLPVATEFLDPIVPQYLSDLISWAAVGARTAESQIHRELASGLPMPVGFKNATDGELTSSINAIISAREPHGFLGINDAGVSAIIHTSGNDAVHLVLRGSENGVNYKAQTIKNAVRLLRAHHLNEGLLVDCSHGNSGKKAVQQISVFRSVLASRANRHFHERKAIRGVMLESFLKTGNCSVERWQQAENYGLSITDECLGWEETVNMLREQYKHFILE